MNSMFSCTRSQNRNGKVCAATAATAHNKTTITTTTKKPENYLFKQLQNALYQSYNPTGIARRCTIKFLKEREKTTTTTTIIIKVNKPKKTDV